MCSSVGRASDPKVVSSSLATFKVMFRDSIVASIPACHAGDQGSIPCRGDSISFCQVMLHVVSPLTHFCHPHMEQNELDTLHAYLST